MLLLCCVGQSSRGTTPNTDIMARGSMRTPSKSEKKVKIDRQKPVNFRTGPEHMRQSRRSYPTAVTDQINSRYDL